MTNPVSSDELKDAIDFQMTKRDLQEAAENLGLYNAPIVVFVPDCECKRGLDDSTEILKCPQCGRPGVERGY